MAAPCSDTTASLTAPSDFPEWNGALSALKHDREDAPHLFPIFQGQVRLQQVRLHLSSPAPPHPPTVAASPLAQNSARAVTPQSNFRRLQFPAQCLGQLRYRRQPLARRWRQVVVLQSQLRLQQHRRHGILHLAVHRCSSRPQ